MNVVAYATNPRRMEHFSQHIARWCIDWRADNDHWSLRRRRRFGPIWETMHDHMYHRPFAKICSNGKSGMKDPYEFVPQLKRLRDDVLYGDVWEQPELSKRDRSLITCAMLVAMYRTTELEWHMRHAITNGVTPDELRGLVTHVAFYAGWPCGVNAGREALNAVGESGT